MLLFAYVSHSGTSNKLSLFHNQFTFNLDFLFIAVWADIR